MLQPIDIGHPDYCALIAPDTAFWSLVRREKLGEVLAGGELLEGYRQKAHRFAEEMESLRFGLSPSAVYFNPTERCNLNCTYCYIPEDMRSGGEHMEPEKLQHALRRLKAYFTESLPEGTRPQIVFHGAEPLLNRDAVFAGIEQFHDYFRFGVQTNATLLDREAVEFLTSRDVSIGISLDAAEPEVTDRTRKDWTGAGVYGKVMDAMEALQDYAAWSVICTVTSENMDSLVQLVDLLHSRRVPTCLMNILRCTLPPAREIKPDDATAAEHFLRALEHTHELYEETGRKLIVGNFANILLAVMAPLARRLMCDISPCGGGRCFFALAPNGDMFPCSEFIGLEEFRGGNLFEDEVENVLDAEAFRAVTGRRVEDIEHCDRCAIRHFCGSPCPAEAHEMNGGMQQRGAFCEFYEEQVRCALRLIADGRQDDYLWDDWEDGTELTFGIGAP